MISHRELRDNSYNLDILSGSLDVHVPQIFHTKGLFTSSNRSKYLYKTCLHDVANTCKAEQYIWTDYWSIVKLVLNIILICEA